MSNLIEELARDARGFRFEFAIPDHSPIDVSSQNLRLTRYNTGSGASLSATVIRILHEQVTLPYRARRASLLFSPADLAPIVPTGVPVVLGIQNLNVLDDRFYRTARLRILRALLPLGARRAAHVVVPSEATRKEVSERLRIPESRITTIHHGLAPCFRSDGTPKKQDSSPSEQYLLLPAALERHKSIHTAIEAMGHLRDTHLQLWLVGSGDTDPSYSDYLRGLVASLGVENLVRFVGPVPANEIGSYYRDAVALVFPSLLETFGLPVLESMAAGTPCILSDLSVFREIAGEGAFYFPPGDADALARNVQGLLRDDAARERVSAVGLERSRAFTWSATADRLCNVFRSVLQTT